MTNRAVRKTTRRVSWILAGSLVAAAVGVALDHQSSASWSSAPSPISTSASHVAIPGPLPPAAVGPDAPGTDATEHPELLDGQHRGGLAEADGALPDHATVFDDALPGVANLDPALLSTLRRAAKAAADDGIAVNVNSGWRSRAYQEHLLQQAIAKYGSRKAAARWVATPDTSTHVSGHAVDVGPTDAAAWLSTHGVRYGLCQIYRNEPWHYELRPAAVDKGCPDMYADPASDPGLQQ